MGQCAGKTSALETDANKDPEPNSEKECGPPTIKQIEFIDNRTLIVHASPPHRSGCFKVEGFVGTLTNHIIRLPEEWVGRRKFEIEYRFLERKSTPWLVDIEIYDDKYLQKTKSARFNTISEMVPMRNIGIEIETDQFEARRPANNKEGSELVTGTHAVLYGGQEIGWELQAELSGRLEFVMLDPRKSPRLPTVVQSMEEFASSMCDIKRGSDFEYEFNEGLFIRRRGADLLGEVQISIGVHLSALKDLFFKSKEFFGNNLRNFSVNPIVLAVDQFRREFRTRVKNVFDISPELEGFLWLVYYYLFVGHYCTNSPFPKGKFDIMARTDFGAIFLSLPEAKFFSEFPKLWYELVLSVPPFADHSDARFFGEAMYRSRKTYPRFQQDAKYDSEDAVEISVTRVQWLSCMTEGIDVLTMHGAKYVDAEHWKIYKTMGASKDDTNLLVDDMDNYWGVILELRGIEQTFPIKMWGEKCNEWELRLLEINCPCLEYEQYLANKRINQLLDEFHTKLAPMEQDYLKLLANQASFDQCQAALIGRVERAFGLLFRKRLIEEIKVLQLGPLQSKE